MARDDVILPVSIGGQPDNNGLYARTSGTVRYVLSSGRAINKTVPAGWSDRRSVGSVTATTASLGIFVPATRRVSEFPRFLRAVVQMAAGPVIRLENGKLLEREVA